MTGARDIGLAARAGAVAVVVLAAVVAARSRLWPGPRAAAWGLVVGVGVLVVVTGVGPIADGGVAAADRNGTVDGFEDGDLDEWERGYDPSNGDSAVQSSTVFDGSYAMSLTTYNGEVMLECSESGAGLGRYPVEGDTFQFRVYNDDASAVSSLDFGPGYAVLLYVEDGRLDLRTDGRSSANVNIPTNEWLRVVVDFGGDTVDATLYDSSGSQLATVTNQNDGGADYDGEICPGIGNTNSGSSTAYFDSIEITSTTTTNGQVTDGDGNAIEGATVAALDSSTGNVIERTNTTVAGEYAFLLDSGMYDIRASKTGYANKTKRVTVPAGGTRVNVTLGVGTAISDPDPPDGATVSEPPVQLSVLANSTNQSVQSIDVDFYRQTNGTTDPATDPQIGSRTVAPGERATVTWDPPPGTYRWYAVGTADSGARDTGGPYRLGVGEADIIDGSEQPPDGANVRPTDNLDLAVDVRVNDDATVEFYDYETGNPENDPLIGSQSVSSGTSTATTRWYSDERDASEEWYAVLSDSTGTRDTAGAFAFGAGGQVIARDAETGEVIDDRTVRFDTTYPGGSETFDRVPANLNLSKVNAEPGDRIRIDVRAQDYYERTVEVSGKQSDADVFLERGANWSYNPSSDEPNDSASVEDDPDRFISRFKLKDQTGRYPASNTTLTVRADVDDDGQTDLVHRSSFGAANRVDVRVVADRRYQLSVENDAGDSRGLGAWTATQPDTTTLTISRVTEDIEIDQGYGVDAVVEDGTLKIYYRDYETRAETLNFEVREYFDGPYLENRTLTDVENATITIALNESQAKKTWQVDYEGSRVGVEAANISGQVTTSATGRVPLPVGSDVLIAGALIILAIVGALFTGPLSAIGSVGMVGVAGVLYFIGWLPINAAALWVATIIAVGSVLRSGGGRLG